MANILFIIDKSIGQEMAGPGVRAWELAKALAGKHKVNVAAPIKNVFERDEVKVFRATFRSTARLFLSSDIIIVQIFFLRFYWLILAWILRKKIIIDAYSPAYMESLEKLSDYSSRAALMNKINIMRIKFLFKIGDYFICSSEKQRDLWMGWLSSLGRLNPATYRTDKSFRKIIGIVPSGIRTERPVMTKGILKGIIPGIQKDDKVVLWFSGIWPWLDPFSAIKAFKWIKNDRIKLVFFGLDPVDPSLSGDDKNLIERAIRLAKEMELYNKNVFFAPGRLPYNEIANILLDADIALNVHRNHLETQYAFRGRVLEFIWAGLPIVTTRGDVLAELINKEQMGIVVDYENETQIAEGIKKLVDDNPFYNQCKENIKETAGKMTWDMTSLPLKEYCDASFVMPDNKSLTSIIGLLYYMVAVYWLSLFYLLKYAYPIKLLRRDK